MPTIALVDDDRNILTSVSIALEAEGYRIMTYTDGASALDGFKTSPPDLAILDIKMPRMDGMETLRRLRQKSDMPVIFLTSKDEEIDELFRPQDGCRRLHSQAVFRSGSWSRRVKAVLRRFFAKRRHISQGSGRQGPRTRLAAHGPGAPYLYLEKRARDPHGYRVLDPAGAGKPSRRCEEPQRPDGCRL